MKRLALLSLVFMSYSVLAAPVLRFKCGDNKFVMYVNASMTKQAVIMNDQLTENSATDQYPYGDLGDSVVITFDVWGANGGMHNHYTTVFPNDSKTIKQIVQILDADDRPRGDAIHKTCTKM
ncbi:hypothetical protein ACRZ6Q_004681 [Citrobacter freundii]|uniref:Uncharacterized protein n=1 Tax=Citrobacter freundii TaxID=546 RepID=A0AAD1TT88_CITFR|nr:MULTISPECIES: hypothetical protein [Enterobacteriaceae]EDS5037447.1 hypothetical protein [Salmonella enterica subsp. enterica serovar Wandsworth]HBU8851107.1 hypothetical protein [Citrobacter sedlakii]ASG43841.1 hypothetical protein CES93_09455 [Citrobacter freundii]EIJ8972514.1 hypothetical protein [Citrobacter freundii]EIJ8977837.1 hypothetical protein [Citrobacter freundii]